MEYNASIALCAGRKAQGECKCKNCCNGAAYIIEERRCKMRISKRCQNIKGSVTLEIDAKAKEMKAQGLDVVGFGAGEPDFDTPEHIRQAAKEALDKGMIAVVAGFQGIDANGDITTLGRGGSDTTAVAVAHGLDADVCEIYSDVDGVYTADPRVCPRAKKLDVISYDDMLELSSSGAGVLQMRAVEFARKYQVVIHSRSAFSDAEGTYIKEETDMMEEAVITGIAHDTSEVKFTIRGVPDMTGVAAKVFSALAGNAVSVDMIIQNISEAGITDISFTCPGADLARAKETIERILPDISARDYDVDEDIAKVSLVGTGMKSSPGVAARAFSTLGENQINILAISTSPIRLSVVVDGAQAAAAVRCLHKAFDLDSDSVFEETQLSAEEIAAKMNKGR